MILMLVNIGTLCQIQPHQFVHQFRRNCGNRTTHRHLDHRRVLHSHGSQVLTQPSQCAFFDTLVGRFWIEVSIDLAIGCDHPLDQPLQG